MKAVSGCLSVVCQLCSVVFCCASVVRLLDQSSIIGGGGKRREQTRDKEEPGAEDGDRKREREREREKEREHTTTYPRQASRRQESQAGRKIERGRLKEANNHLHTYVNCTQLYGVLGTRYEKQSHYHLYLFGLDKKFTAMSNGHQQPQRATTPSSDININNNNNYTTTTTHPPTTITQEYRPCSPDLSAYGIPSHSQQHQQQQSLSHRNYQDQHSPSTNHSRPASFQLRQGSSTALTGLPGDAGSSSIGGYPPAQPTHRGSYDASPYFCPQAGFSQGGYFTGPILQRRETSGYGSLSARTASDLGEHRSRVPSSGGGGLTYSPTAISSAEAFPSNQQESRNQNQLGFAPNSVSDSGTPAQTPTFPPISSSISKQQQQQLDMPPSRRKRGQTDDKTNNGDVDPTPEPSTTTDKAPGAKNSRKRKSDSGHQAWTVGRAPGDVGPSLGIDIKTKFPVARIKRIMQADEDVGKVAQATPTAVCKLPSSSLLFSSRGEANA